MESAAETKHETKDKAEEPQLNMIYLVEKRRLDMSYPTDFQEVNVVVCDQFLLQC